MYGLSLFTYDVTMLRSLQGSTKGTAEGNLKGLLLCSLIGSVFAFVISVNKGTIIGLWGGKFLGRTLGGLVGI